MYHFVFNEFVHEVNFIDLYTPLTELAYSIIYLTIN